MSDLYLDLRARIPVVAARTIIGTERIQEAQDRTGLSNERVARLIPVSEKTWRRWKAAGEIPTASLPAVAKALGLDLRGDDPRPLLEGEADRLERLEARMDEAVELLAEALELLRAKPRRRASGE